MAIRLIEGRPDSHVLSAGYINYIWSKPGIANAASSRYKCLGILAKVPVDGRGDDVLQSEEPGVAVRDQSKASFRLQVFKYSALLRRLSNLLNPTGLTTFPPCGRIIQMAFTV